MYLSITAIVSTVVMASTVATADKSPAVQLGPRPFWLIDQMRDIPLKTELGESIILYEDSASKYESC